MFDIVIVGAGTAGLTAAIYGARAGKRVLVLEQAIYGGQIIYTPEVVNYPGIKSISGADFANSLYEQAVGLGAELEFVQGTQLIWTPEKKAVVADGKEIPARAVVLATGAQNRLLGLKREQELLGRGISYCANCDGAFFKGMPVAVVGGGVTAVDDANYLSGICPHVTLIHRRDEFRVSQNRLENLKQRPNVEIKTFHVVTELHGDRKLETITVQDTRSGETSRIEAAALFIAAGQIPQNKDFSPPVQLDEAGYIAAGEDCRTNLPGVFAAGDCRSKTVRQLATAAGDGAVAGRFAAEYVDFSPEYEKYSGE